MRSYILFLLGIISACGQATKIQGPRGDSGEAEPTKCLFTKIEGMAKPDLPMFQEEIDNFFSNQQKHELLYVKIVSGTADGILKRIILEGDSISAYKIENQGTPVRIDLKDELLFTNLIHEMPPGHYLQTCIHFSSVDYLTLIFLKKEGQITFSVNYDDLRDLSDIDSTKFKKVIELDNLLRKI